MEVFLTGDDGDPAVPFFDHMIHNSVGAVGIVGQNIDSLQPLHLAVQHNMGDARFGQMMQERIILGALAHYNNAVEALAVNAPVMLVVIDPPHHQIVGILHYTINTPNRLIEKPGRCAGVQCGEE
ncbi:hypothetical protein D3C81_1971530 [compost metagenome]